MKRQFKEFLKDILLEIDVIQKSTKNISFEEFVENEIIVRAVTRSFEIIGEAVSNVPIEIKNKYSHIPWRDIKDFRNVIVHQYWSIDYTAEWKIIQNKLDPLKEQIIDILKEDLNIIE